MPELKGDALERKKDFLLVVMNAFGSTTVWAVAVYTITTLVLIESAPDWGVVTRLMVPWALVVAVYCAGKKVEDTAERISKAIAAHLVKDGVNSYTVTVNPEEPSS